MKPCGPDIQKRSGTCGKPAATRCVEQEAPAPLPGGLKGGSMYVHYGAFRSTRAREEIQRATKRRGRPATHSGNGPPSQQEARRRADGDSAPARGSALEVFEDLFYRRRSRRPPNRLSARSAASVRHETAPLIRSRVAAHGRAKTRRVGCGGTGGEGQHRRLVDAQTIGYRRGGRGDLRGGHQPGLGRRSVKPAIAVTKRSVAAASAAQVSRGQAG